MKAEPDESVEVKLPDAEESLAMRKLLVSLQSLTQSVGSYVILQSYNCYEVVGVVHT